MIPPPNDALSPADPAEDVFVQLLAAWDERLASGKSTPTQLPEHSTSVDGLRERLEKAQDCLKLLNQLWPKQTPGSSHHSGPAAYARFGRYEIIRELGRGGHGVVFLAADPSLKRQVAIKVPRPAVLANDELRLRFLREAEATARLDHPNILHVYEVGCEGPVCFTAAAYCDGGTLQDWLARDNAPLEPRPAAQIVAELAAAIHHAHTRGVLHRDLKPSNVLLASRHEAIADCGLRIADHESNPQSAIPNPQSSSGRLLDGWVLKIADFGLAKVIDGQQDSTMHGVVMGTANYMAPEQAAGRNADVGVTTDVYSLGVILYELLTGAPPLVAASQLATLKRVEGDEAAFPSKVRRRIPADLRTICLTCLEKDPLRRYPSAAALASDLNRFLRGEPVTARPLSLAERMRRTFSRHPALSLLSAAAICLAIGFVAQLYLHNQELSAKNAELAILIKNEREHARSLDALRQVAEERAEENRRRSLGAKLRVAQQFANAGSLRQMTEALHETFPQGDEQDLREFAWRYWWNQCRGAEVFHLPGHGKFVNAVACSADGNLIATGSDDASVRVWQAATGLELARLYGLKESVRHVAFSPDGKLLAAGDSRGGVMAWSTSDWKRSRMAESARESPIVGLGFGDEETLVAGFSSGLLTVWDPGSGQIKQRRPLSNGRQITSMAIAPRSRQLLLGTQNNDIQIRSLDDLTKRPEIIKWHEAPVCSIAISVQEHRSFTCDEKGNWRLWDLPARQTLLKSPENEYPRSSVAISPDGQWLAAVTLGEKVRVLSADTGEIVKEKNLGLTGTGGLTFTQDSRGLIIAGGEGQASIWQPFDERPEQPVGHDVEAWSATFTHDSSMLITGSDDQTVKLWRTSDGKLIKDLLNQKGTVAAVALSPDGTILATTSLEESTEYPEKVRLWKMPTGELIKGLQGHSGRVYSAAFHPTRNVLVTGAQAVIVWDVASGRQIKSLNDSQNNDKKVKSIAFSRDGSLLAFASEDGNTYLYRYPELDKPQVLESGDEVWAVAFSPDGQLLATGNRDGSVIVWDPHTLKRRFTLKGHLLGVLCVAFSDDGQTIATGSEDLTIKLWGPHTGQELSTLRGHKEKIMCVKFSPDNQWLASCSYDGGVRLWHAPVLPAPVSSVRRVAQGKQP
ncbi:MAG TPA: protein kinase [Pirellulaceae bacterium]|nr:protein kinase [Pirellulaceae bacterium]